MAAHDTHRHRLLCMAGALDAKKNLGWQLEKEETCPCPLCNLTDSHTVAIDCYHTLVTSSSVFLNLNENQ